MRNAQVLIADEISGSGDIFIDPANVNEVIVFPSLYLSLKNGGRLELKPSAIARKAAREKVIASLFQADVIERADSLAKCIGRWINVSNVETINYRAGLIWATMTDGQMISSQPKAFSDYKAAVAVLYGKEAADQLKPLVPEPLVMERKPKPQARRPALSVEEQREKMISDAHDSIRTMSEPKPVRTLGKITTTDPVARAAAIGGVVETLEMIATELGGYGGSSTEGIAAFSKRVQDLRTAQVRLSAQDTSGNLAYVEHCALEVRSMTYRLPKDEAGQRAQARILEEATRLEGMPASATQAA